MRPLAMVSKLLKNFCGAGLLPLRHPKRPHRLLDILDRMLAEVLVRVQTQTQYCSLKLVRPEPVEG